MTAHTPALPSPAGGAPALAAAACLLAACATIPPVSSGPSSLLVRNAGADPCELFVDRQYLQQVEPLTAVTVRNLPAGPYSIELACRTQTVRRNIRPARGETVEVPGEAGLVLDRTASLAMRNATPFDVDVSVSGTSLGRVFSGSTTLFPDVPSGDQVLTFLDPTSGGEWSLPATLPPARTSAVDVPAPNASLTLTNDTREPIRATVRGRTRKLAPGASDLFPDLPPGRCAINAIHLDSGRTALVEVFLDPGAVEDVRLSANTGDLLVHNRLGEPLDLLMDGEPLATVEAGTGRRLSGLAAGKVTLEARTRSGKASHQTFVVVPDAVETWIVEAPNARILVTNRIGEQADLYADGRMVVSLADGASVRFTASPGPHSLSARCLRTGHVDTHILDLPGGELTEVAFGPQAGRLVVDNRTGNTLVAYRNGRPLSPLPPLTRIEYSGQPLGTNLVEVLNEAGTAVHRGSVEVAPPGGEKAQVVLSGTGLKVRVVNETGEPVKVGPGTRPEGEVIEAGGEALLEMDGLAGTIRLAGTVTRNRYDLLVQAAGREKAEGEIVRVLRPVAAGLVVENLAGAQVQILLDGEPLQQLPPGDTLFRDRMALGRHVLSARLDGATDTLDEVSFVLAARTWYFWKVGEKTGRLRVVNRTDEELRLSISGVEAGRLPAGAETVLDRLPARRVTLTTIGTGSNQFQAFEWIPEAGRSVTWIVRSATGGLKLVGFEGRRAVVYVDHEEALRVEPGRPEPVAVPLEPGLHLVKVVPETPGEHGPGEAGAAGRCPVRTSLVRSEPNLFVTFRVSGTEPEIEVRNRTGETLLLELDGLPGGKVPAGGTLEVLLEEPGVHTVRAHSEDGRREWLLRQVYFREGGRFGWTLE